LGWVKRIKQERRRIVNGVKAIEAKSDGKGKNPGPGK